jgi:hypothetical protein
MYICEKPFLKSFSKPLDPFRCRSAEAEKPTALPRSRLQILHGRRDKMHQFSNHHHNHDETSAEMIRRIKYDKWETTTRMAAPNGGSLMKCLDVVHTLD